MPVFLVLLQDPLAVRWGPTVTLVIASGGAAYALWRKAVLPAMVLSIKQLGEAAHKERFMQLDHALQAIGTLHRSQVYTSDQLDRVEQMGERIETKLEAHGSALAVIAARLDEWDKRTDR